MTEAAAEGSRLPISVIVPTIGTDVELLNRCISSIAGCGPPPAEILVVDQSGKQSVRAVVQDHASCGCRLVSLATRGIARATNAGMRAASHDLVMRTDDDCTVAPDWVELGYRHLTADPQALVTGRVLPGGQAAHGVPSTKADTTPREYQGVMAYWLLYSGNMAVDRRYARDLGGFDERAGLRIAASDNDFCYRWLRSGRRLRYEPALVVWHHDWRTPEGLERRYVEYGRGQGVFYAKHLHGGHWHLLPRLAREVATALRGVAGAVRRKHPLTTDSRWGLLRGLPSGLFWGWREARRISRETRADSFGEHS